MAYKYQLGTAILSGALSPGANNSFGLGIDGAAWSDLHISRRWNASYSNRWST